jgi:hypothetical protein
MLRCVELVSKLSNPVAWASQAHLAARLGCSERQVGRYISVARREGLIQYNRRTFMKEGRFTSVRRMRAGESRSRFGIVIHSPYLGSSSPRPKVSYCAGNSPDALAVPLPTAKPAKGFGKPKYDWADRPRTLDQAIAEGMKRIEEAKTSERAYQASPAYTRDRLAAAELLQKLRREGPDHLPGKARIDLIEKRNKE